MKFSRVSRDFFCSLVIAVERPLVNQLAYPYRPQSLRKKIGRRDVSSPDFFLREGGRLYTGYSNRGRKAFG